MPGLRCSNWEAFWKEEKNKTSIINIYICREKERERFFLIRCYVSFSYLLIYSTAWYGSICFICIVFNFCNYMRVLNVTKHMIGPN